MSLFSYQSKTFDIEEIHFFMTMILIWLFLIISMMANLIFAGITIPKNNCKWLDGGYGIEVKCDGNEVAVGACG